MKHAAEIGPLQPPSLNWAWGLLATNRSHRRSKCKVSGWTSIELGICGCTREGLRGPRDPAFQTDLTLHVVQVSRGRPICHRVPQRVSCPPGLLRWFRECAGPEPSRQPPSLSTLLKVFRKSQGTTAKKTAYDRHTSFYCT